MLNFPFITLKSGFGLDFMLLKGFPNIVFFPLKLTIQLLPLSLGLFTVQTDACKTL